jgi:hypothetical protein
MNRNTESVILCGGLLALLLLQVFFAVMCLPAAIRVLWPEHMYALSLLVIGLLWILLAPIITIIRLIKEFVTMPAFGIGNAMHWTSCGTCAWRDDDGVCTCRFGPRYRRHQDRRDQPCREHQMDAATRQRKREYEEAERRANEEDDLRRHNAPGA